MCLCNALGKKKKFKGPTKSPRNRRLGGMTLYKEFITHCPPSDSHVTINSHLKLNSTVLIL